MARKGVSYLYGPHGAIRIPAYVGVRGNFTNKQLDRMINDEIRAAKKHMQAAVHLMQAREKYHNRAEIYWANLAKESETDQIRKVRTNLAFNHQAMADEWPKTSKESIDAITILTQEYLDR
jgi:hypothetical protein